MVDGGTLGLFESEAQLAALLAWGERDGVVIELVAATATAELAALKRGLTCATVEDFVDEAAVMADGLALFRRLADFCGWLDGFIAERLGEEISPWFAALDFVYSLKLALDRLYYRTILLTRLLNARRPARIIGFSSFHRPPGGREEGGLPYRSVLMTVLSTVATGHGVETVLLPAPEAVPAESKAPEPSGPDLWPELLRQVNEIRGAGGAERFAVFGPYWSNPQLSGALQHRGMPSIRLALLTDGLPEPDAADLAAADAIWRAVRRAPAYRDLLTFEDVDVSALAEPAFAPVVRAFLPRQRRQVPALAGRLRDLGDAVLVTSSIVFPAMATAFRAARLAGTPSVVVQHGGMWYFSALLSYYTDPRLPDHYVCYGPGAAAAIEDLARSPLLPSGERPARLTAAGCRTAYGLLGQSPVPRTPGRGIRVLYLTTSLSGEEYYFSANRHADIWYARLRRDAIAYCAGRAGVELTVRPAPGTGPGDPLHDWLMLARPGCRYAPTGPIEPLLLDADVIVVDYASSVLLHAVATPARIVCLFRPEPINILPATARAALSRRAWVAEDRDGFLAAIDTAVDECRTGAPNSRADPAFMTSFASDSRTDPVTAAVDCLATAAAWRA